MPMDLSRTQLTGLLNNVSHEKTKFIQLMHKLKAILSLNKDHKLILTSLDKLILTSSPLLIYQNINFSHPILKILTEIMEKTRKMGEGEKLFIEILKKLVDKVTYLLDNGIKAKVISDTLKDFIIKSEQFEKEEREQEEHEDESSLFIGKKIKSYISEMMRDETISKLIIDSVENTRSFDSENIRICKVATGSTEDSYKVEGMLLNKAPEGTVRALSNTSVGVFNCPFDINRTELKGTVLMSSAAELLNFSTDEVAAAKALVDSLNVNVVIVCGTVNELFVDFANSRNILVLRVFSKFDLKRLAALCNAEIYTALGPVHRPGLVKSVSAVQDGSSCFTRVIGGGNVNTIVIKNTMPQKCDEIERKIGAILETLKKNQKNIEKSFLEFSKPSFFNESSKIIGNATVIHTTISEGLKQVEYKRMILEDQVKCVRYAFDFLATMLEVDDYLVARVDQLNIKPQNNQNWDADD